MDVIALLRAITCAKENSREVGNSRHTLMQVGDEHTRLRIQIVGMLREASVSWQVVYIYESCLNDASWKIIIFLSKLFLAIESGFFLQLYVVKSVDEDEPRHASIEKDVSSCTLLQLDTNSKFQLLQDKVVAWFSSLQYYWYHYLAWKS